MNLENTGVVTIATGDKAKQENKLCIESIHKHLPDIEVVTLSDTLEYSDMVASRVLKTSLINRIPPHWQYCVYLDSDTRIQSKDILSLIDILQSGYDLVICPSEHNDFWHIDDIEREYTFDQLGYTPLQLQFGVFGFSVNPKMKNFFLRLSNEYMLYYNQDQCALVRTLHDIPIPVKYWLLGYPFNSGKGSVIQHLFGRTR